MRPISQPGAAGRMGWSRPGRCKRRGWMSAAERVALVTGGSRGIGQAIALRLAHDGIAVAVNYRGSAEAAAETVRRIADAGGQAVALAADVAATGEAAKL